MMHEDRQRALTLTGVNLVVEAGATFIPAKCPGNTGLGTTYLKGLSGEGTLLGHDDAAYWFIVKDTTPHGPFAGKVENFILPRIESGGTLSLRENSPRDSK